MPRPHPEEFRDVIAVARRGDASIAEVARDFGVSGSCLRNWLHRADLKDGNRPSVTVAESAELRELKRRNRLPDHRSRRKSWPRPWSRAIVRQGTSHHREESSP